MVGLWTFVLGLDEIGPTVTSTWHFLVNFCGFATMGVLVMGLGFACTRIWHGFDVLHCLLLLMMGFDFPLAFNHKKGEYIFDLGEHFIFVG